MNLFKQVYIAYYNHVSRQHHICVGAHWDDRFVELNPELIKCKIPQFPCEVIIISSYRMIPRH